MRKIVYYPYALPLAVHSLRRKPRKPVIHGKNWMAITGKPLAATAGAQDPLTRAETPWMQPALCSLLPARCGMC